jgi:glycosyltransferase involved in cell wall biosynthesis
MRIVFWENIVSQHKLPYWKYLAKSGQVSQFVLVVEQELSSQLKEQGWQTDIPNLQNFSVVVNPNSEVIRKILSEKTHTSFHIFSGIRAVPMVYSALKISFVYNVKRILLTESVNTLGLRFITRRLASFFIERKYLKHYDIVLGSGKKTKNWYLECGVKPKNFYSFLYAVKSIDSEIAIVKNQKLKLVFVGRVEKAKGLDVLLEALKTLKGKKFQLDIYGGLVEEDVFRQMVADFELEDNVVFKGVKSNSELRLILRDYDTLVLPSRWDGWGAVINEAIHSGLKVICSDRCGASILIINDKIGHVFDIKKPQSLAKLLEQYILEKDQFNPSYILDYSQYIKGEQVAQYLINIINFHYKSIGDRPLPPWEKFQLEIEAKAINQHLR